MFIIFQVATESVLTCGVKWPKIATLIEDHLRPANQTFLDDSRSSGVTSYSIRISGRFQCAQELKFFCSSWLHRNRGDCDFGLFQKFVDEILSDKQAPDKLDYLNIDFQFLSLLCSSSRAVVNVENQMRKDTL